MTDCIIDCSDSSQSDVFFEPLLSDKKESRYRATQKRASSMQTSSLHNNNLHVRKWLSQSKQDDKIFSDLLSITFYTYHVSLPSFHIHMT